MSNPNFKKFYLKGLTPLGYSFYAVLISAIIVSIFNHLIPGIYTLGLFIVLLILELVGIIRKSGAYGDTASESLWYLTQGFKARKNLIAFIGLAIASQIVAFGFMYRPEEWEGFSTLIEVAPWSGGYFIFSKLFLIFVSIGMAVWLWPHFRRLGKIGVWLLPLISVISCS